MRKGGARRKQSSKIHTSVDSVLISRITLIRTTWTPAGQSRRSTMSADRAPRGASCTSPSQEHNSTLPLYTRLCFAARCFAWPGAVLDCMADWRRRASCSNDTKHVSGASWAAWESASTAYMCRTRLLDCRWALPWHSACRRGAEEELDATQHAPAWL